MNKADHLRNVPIFSDLSDSDLTKIALKMVPREYGKGKMILLEESHGESFFIITSGAVKVTRLSDDGREVILAILGESDFFGEMSLLDGAGRSANIVANETAIMLTLSRRDFLECLESYPKIAISLLEELAIRLRKSDQQIESLSLSDSEQRIGITLIRLAEELGTIKQGNVFIKNLPFQQDIANMAGTSRETVSRTLKLLEDKSLIMKENRVLTIFNFDSFRKTFS
jgi:CRP/FNR family cyclic AMP-dependent transcriptional regulator